MIKSLNLIFLGLLIICSFTCSKFKPTNLKLESALDPVQNHPANQMFASISTEIPISSTNSPILRNAKLNLPSDELVETNSQVSAKKISNKLPQRTIRREGDKLELFNGDSDNLIEKENNNQVRDVDKGEDKVNFGTQDNLLEQPDKDEDVDSELDETE